MIDRADGRCGHIGAMTVDTAEGRACKRSLTHVSVALLARDRGVPASERKCRPLVPPSAEKRVTPRAFVVAALTVQAELSGVPVAVAAGAGLGEADSEAARMTALASDLRMGSHQRESGASMIELGIRPTALAMAGAAVFLCGRRRLRPAGQRRDVRRTGSTGCAGRRPTGRGANLAPTRGDRYPAGRRQQQQDADDRMRPHGSSPRKSPWWKST